MKANILPDAKISQPSRLLAVWRALTTRRAVPTQKAMESAPLDKWWYI